MLISGSMKVFAVEPVELRELWAPFLDLNCVGIRQNTLKDNWVAEGLL